ncbi:MAG: site-specific DNA-methyltransferase [Anaerolineales bacterium]|nr:site-specific DNA-methyltransferase [Anaerolineales bacterium]
MHDNLDELRHIEGFPIGEDEDIHALSNPPFYTAYPNPHIVKFIEKFGTPYDEATDDYHREPYVGDVSVGKSDQIYRVHSYHTKVPHRAIRRFIEHYTEEGDVILDCFAGTGMTGVAAQLANRKCVLIELSPLANVIAESLCIASVGIGKMPPLS